MSEGGLGKLLWLRKSQQKLISLKARIKKILIIAWAAAAWLACITCLLLYWLWLSVWAGGKEFAAGFSDKWQWCWPGWEDVRNSFRSAMEEASKEVSKSDNQNPKNTTES